MKPGEIQNYVSGGTQKESFADNVAAAEAFTFDDNIGFDFFTEVKRLYEDANTKEVIFKTGLKTIDDLIGGGLHEKSLTLWMSGTNVRKDSDNVFACHQFYTAWISCFVCNI